MSLSDYRTRMKVTMCSMVLRLDGGGCESLALALVGSKVESIVTSEMR